MTGLIVTCEIEVIHAMEQHFNASLLFQRVDWVNWRYKEQASTVETDGPSSFEETLHLKIKGEK